MTEKQSNDHDTSKKEDLESLSKNESQSLFTEFIAFLGSNKKWWLTPVIIAIILLSILVMFGGSSLAPLIYPFF